MSAQLADYEEVSGGSLGAIPQFPPDVLPAAARSVAESGSLPHAYIAGTALAALATVIGPRVQIERGDHSYRQRANMNVAIIGPTGSGKSPALGIALAPARDWDAAHWNQEQVDEAHHGNSRTQDPTLLMGDFTMEALSNRLVAADGSATVAADELSQFLHSLGEYKRAGSDRDRLMELWTGDPWRSTRVGRGDTLVVNPTVIVVGGMVPGAHTLLGTPEDGFRPRWLPHLAGWAKEDSAESTLTTPEWRTLLTANLLPYRGNPRTWALTSAADRAFAAAQREWRTLARGPEPASVAAAMRKADVHLLRIALVLAEAEHPARGGPVSEDVIVRAAAWVGFVLDCFRALPEQGTFALSRRDEVLDAGVDAIANWLEERDAKSATERELRQAHVGGIRTGRDMAEALDRYEATYPGSIYRYAVQGGSRVMVYAPHRGPVSVAKSVATAEVDLATETVELSVAKSAKEPFGSNNHHSDLKLGAGQELSVAKSPSQNAQTHDEGLSVATNLATDNEDDLPL
jgi:hypothetical protein